MIEKNWENQGHREEQDQHVAVIGAYYQQAKEADQKDHEFGCDDVREYRANKKPFFTLKKREAMRAVVPDVKRM